MQGEIQKTDLSVFKCIKARLDAIKYARECIAKNTCSRYDMIKLLAILECKTDASEIVKNSREIDLD